MFKPLIVAFVTALTTASCTTTQPEDRPWVSFGSSGMVTVPGTYFGKISQSGVVTLQVYSATGKMEEYRSYLSQAERSRLRRAIEDFTRKHGDGIW